MRSNFERSNPDLYNRLIAKGVSPKEIERVYRTLRERGYGEEEARNRSRAILSRVKAARDLSERRKGRIREAYEPADEWGETLEELPSAEAPDEEMKRRAVDWLSPLTPRLRRKIDFWAFRNGFRIVRFGELFNDFLGLFNKRRKDHVSRDFLKLLADRKGFLLTNPFELSLIDTLSALRHASRRILGADRPGRRIAERDAARDIEEGVKRSLRAREPFALEFFGLFDEPCKLLRRSLEYANASLKADLRVETAALARVVKETYRLILMTERIEQEKLTALLDAVKEITLTHDRRNRASTEFADAQTLFMAAFQNFPLFKHELYPAVLKMISAFYREDDRSVEKTARIYSFLDLEEGMILSYEGYQKRLAEVRERALMEQRQLELERLEQEKREKFSYRFEGTLATLSSLFPDSGIDRVEQGEFVLPYFMNRVFPRHPVLQRRLADVESLSSSDVMGLIVVIHMIADDLLDSVNGYVLERILSREGLGGRIAELKDAWSSMYDTLFEPYLDEIRELARETSGDPRYVKLFRESMRARSIEERANQLRNHAIKNYGHLLAERDLYETPRLYELADMLDDTLAEIGEGINPDILDAEDPMRRKIRDDLAATPVVDFAARSDAGTPEYRPVTRQVRRYVEARYRQDHARNPALAQVVFFDVFRGVADLYTYVLNDRKSFAAQTGHVLAVAGDDERAGWVREKEERGREDPLALQSRLGEDFPGQFVDELTGLKNKSFFLSELPKHVEKLRAAGKPLALLMIDIDHFKWVNDELGHPEGDEVLKATARIILDSVREGDLAIRYGGEEILLAVPEDLYTAVILAERLRFIQEQNLPLKSAFIGLKLISDERKEPCGTLSIGVAEASAVPDIGSAVELADKALYEAKRARNTVVFLDPEKPAADRFTTYAAYKQSSAKERDSGRQPKEGE
jgi:diguanylate cyclase (GGDEF)-like protein